MEEQKVCTNLNGVKYLRKLVHDNTGATLRVPVGIKIVKALKAASINPCTVTYGELVATLAEGGLRLKPVAGEVVLVTNDFHEARGEYVNALDLSGDWGSVKVRLHQDVVEGAASIAKAIAAFLEGVTKVKR